MLATYQQQQIGGRSAPAPDHDEYADFLERVIQSVEPYVGLRPYVWGGKSPNPGWDCSGLVGWAYTQALGRDPFSLWFTDTIFAETVDSTAPQSGEIVLYEYQDSGQPGVRFPHMGLWIDERTTLDSRGGVGLDYHAHLAGRTRYVRRIPVPTSGGGTSRVLDTTGVDIGPLIQAAASRYAVPAYVLLGLLIAESGLNPNAAREGIWPDVSYGLSQMTVATASGYGIGDGSSTRANRDTVKAVLLDRQTSIDLGARHYAGNVAFVRSRKPGESGDALWLDGLRVYNGGSGALDNPDWEQRWSGNVANYRAALAWAHGVFGE